MTAYFARLNPTERRFVIGVGIVLFLVVNMFWVWPYFSAWSNLKTRLNNAWIKVASYQSVIQQADRLKPELRKLEGEGAAVPLEDQSVEFMRTIQMQAGQSGVNITGYGHQTTRTNQFFTEQSQTISMISGEKQLIDFLYSLGSRNSLVRVSSIAVHPDPSRQQLTASVTLVASYQKNPITRTATTPTPRPAAAIVPAKAPAQQPQPPVPARAQPLTPKKK